MEKLHQELTINPQKKLFFKNSIMTKEKIIEAIERVLQTDHKLEFLSQLNKPELETLLASIRYKIHSYEV